MNFNALLEDEGMEIPEPAMTGELVPFDYGKELVKVRSTLETYRPELNRMVEMARAHKVTDVASQNQAVEMGTQSQKFISKINLLVKSTIEEADDFVRTVRNTGKVFTEPLETIKKDMGSKIDIFVAAERRRKAELEEIARREARELQDRLNREAREKAEEEAKVRAQLEAELRGVPVEEIPVVVEPVQEVTFFEPVVEQTKTTVRAESGSGTAYQRKGDWTYRLTDMSKVPIEYLLVNGPLVNKKIKGGVRDIPGLEIYQAESKTQFKSR